MTRCATIPKLSLSQAAKLTSKSKFAINTGKLSALQHEDGSYSLDPSKHSRAFSLEPQEGSERLNAEPDANRLLERVEALEAMLNRECEISADIEEDWNC